MRRSDDPGALLARLLVAAPASGSGKTTVALALAAAARRRGLVVQPFKVGPDFIDPGHMARVAGRPARTLDGWMLGRDACRASFTAAAARADVAIVEGMMGLFDGVGPADETGSSAEMAKWLDLPVLLVVDAAAMARSAAAVVRGFRDFDPEVRITGVVFNRVGGAAHLELLHDALRAAGLPACVGGLPDGPELRVPERHLGLVTAAETGVPFATLADAAERHLDVDAILRLASARRDGAATDDHAGRPPGNDPSAGGAAPRPDASSAGRSSGAVRIAVARDAAFSFYYPENVERLADAGAEIVEFSPIADARLPPDVDGVYLGGGYPEVHAAALAANATLLAELRALAAAGGLVYAECGGLMYLGAAIEDEAGTTHAMAGVLPLRTSMRPRTLTIGYREVEIGVPFLPRLVVRGHEFHGATSVPSPDAAAMPHAYVVRDPRTAMTARAGYCVGRTLASWVHLHFASAPALAPALVEAARRRSRS